MKRYSPGAGRVSSVARLFHFSWSLLMGLMLLAPAHAATRNVTLQVEDHNGAPVSGFRWLLEEDATHPVSPGVHTTDTLSLTFHTSHMPVVQQGEATGSSTSIAVDDTRRYFISVLPFSGYSNGGAQIAFTGAATPPVKVVVAQHPIPTAQISILVFEDSQPINSSPDLPQEKGLAGFSVLLFDPAGQYGIAGGQISQDAFGNPLGTAYNTDGTVAQLGNGVILTDATGVARVRNLAPGKYGVQIVPPAAQNWRQTNTIEGTRTIDALVRANEPSYFAEFGPTAHHVFFGFVQPFDCYNSAVVNPPGYCAGTAVTGGSSVSGRIVNLHTSRPPVTTSFNGHPIPGCWIGLNDALAGTGHGVYAQPCNADSTFAINNVPAGSYTLAVWDEALDVIFTTLNLTVPAGGGAVMLGDVPVFNWYHRMENIVFFDRNQNGFRDCVTPACDNQALDDVNLGADQAFINLRFRDGRVYQSMPIDISGVAPFDEVFPFFHWLVAEVSFSTLKATGATVTVDAGGPVAPGEVLNPQPQTCTQADITAGVCTTPGAALINPNTGNNLSRTETGPVLLEAFQGFLGQTNRVEWGKSTYGAGENGGISGIVFYAVTRAEADPRYAVGEEWEPGIPRVQVNLYHDADGLGTIADNNGDGTITHADVDNHPLGWSSGGVKGAEDVDRNLNGVFDLGDALRITHTDSFDDSHPAGCQGAVYTIENKVIDCFDGMRNYNQVRPGVFDGGYAFGPHVTGDPTDPPLASGIYIVEAVVPPGYQIVKEEDKNVDFGDAYTPSPLLLPTVCVGDGHLVPPYLSLQSDAAGTPYPGIAAADLVAAPFAGTSRPLCDRRQVRLAQGQNAAADFFLFTEAPKAAMVVGIIFSNQGNEFNPGAPTFGEKFAPAWLPVAFRDWTGREIARVHADEWGKFNATLPSTYSVHIPMPSGVSPNMITACMNDPGPVSNPAYDAVNNPTVPALIADPFYDRRFSQFCYTFQYMPGGTTYLDTPVQPIAAFAGAGKPLDCEQPDTAPLVHSVSGPLGSGPLVNVGEVLTITAVGDMSVPNPAFDGVTVTNPTLIRHYGFGNLPGTLTLGGVALTNVNWSDGIITATVPAGAVTGQLTITRADGLSAPSGVTVTVGPLPAGVSVHRVVPSGVAGATPIQDAIDIARPNDLILIQPGSYDEMVIMYKPVRLQGYGAYSTVINARQTPTALAQWRTKLATLFGAGAFDLLPGQTAAVAPGAALLPDGEGAGITVVGKGSGLWGNRFSATNKARIDGVTITGANHGGGIFVNGYARQLEISNNRVIGNQGQLGGGIRIGHADLTSVTATGTVYTHADNGDIKIHHNEVTQNGSLGNGGVGGGIALYTGTSNYRVDANYICGNFSTGSGGGIGHLGLSSNGVISGNAVLFNQSFNPTLAVSGGGIYVAGQAPLAGIGSVTPGTGHVVIDGNLIQGNQSGAGDGGGVRLERINGADVVTNPAIPYRWNRIKFFNNMVVNNVAGLAAGGISLVDALQVKIDHNTIAHNDSTATAGEAFVPGNPSASVPQPAGIVSHVHSDGLNAVIPAGANYDVYRNYSKPQLIDNIIWQNRSFHWAIQGNAANPTYGLLPDIGAGQPPVFHDLGVLGVAGRLFAQSCILTDTTGYNATNRALDPSFVLGFFNGDRGQTIQQPGITSMLAQPAFDEGGNFIDVRFGPLTPGGSYHLNTGSPVINAGSSPAVFATFPELTVDYNGDNRPQGGAPDIGADEVVP